MRKLLILFLFSTGIANAQVTAPPASLGNWPTANTAIALADPGTPAAGGTIVGWDDTDNAFVHFTIGSGLTYTHGTHTLTSAAGGGTVPTGTGFYHITTAGTLDAAAVGESGTGNVVRLTSGVVAPAILGTGSAITTKFLRGDSTWQTVSGGAVAGVDTQVQYNDSGAFGGSAGFLFDKTSKITLGVAGTSVGKIDFKNATSGTVTLQAVTGALGSPVVSLPALSGVVLLDSAVQTISNHTLDSSNAVAAAGITGTLAASHGGTGVDSSGNNGFPTLSGGVWSFVKTVPTGAVVGTTDTQTLTNKAITPRSASTTTSATPTPNSDTTDLYILTALTDATATFGAPTGTPTVGQRLMIRITDSGGPRTLAWNSGTGGYSAAPGLALPLATTASKTMYLLFIYNATGTAKWNLLASLDGF